MEPAPAGFAEWHARQAERDRGKAARRQGHDAKWPGETDRTKDQLREDYEWVTHRSQKRTS